MEKLVYKVGDWVRYKFGNNEYIGKIFAVTFDAVDTYYFFERPNLLCLIDCGNEFDDFSKLSFLPADVKKEMHDKIVWWMLYDDIIGLANLSDSIDEDCGGLKNL